MRLQVYHQFCALTAETVLQSKLENGICRSLAGKDQDKSQLCQVLVTALLLRQLCF